MENKLKLKDLLITIILLLIIIATNTFFISLNINNLRNKLDKYENKTEETQAYKQEIVIKPYDNITDLSGTSWQFNNYLNSTPSSTRYYINFESNSNSYAQLRCTSSNDSIHLEYRYPSTIVYDSSWSNQAYRTINITDGGVDAKNTDLISWFQSNATQIISGPTQLTTPTLTKTAYNQISWSTIQNAEYYEIYKNNELYATTIETFYNVNSLGNFQVIAVGDDTNYSNSEISNTITINSIKLTQPQIYINNGILNWEEIQNASGYEIYKDNILIDTLGVAGRLYTTNSTGNYQVKAISNNIFFTDSNLSTAINVIEYNIKYNLGNVIIIGNKPNKILTSRTITIVFEPFNNYNLPTNTYVYGASSTWDKDTGTLTINNPTNEVEINVNAEYQSGQLTMVELLDSVIMVPTNTFYNMFNFELLGVNLYNLLLGALTLLIIFKIYMKIFK